MIARPQRYVVLSATSTHFNKGACLQQLEQGNDSCLKYWVATLWEKQQPLKSSPESAPKITNE